MKKNKFEVIQRCAGLLVAKGYITPETILSWRHKKYVPEHNHLNLIDASMELGFNLTIDEILDYNKS